MCVYEYVFIFKTEHGVVRGDDIIDAAERVKDATGDNVVTITRATEVDYKDTGYINILDMWD